MIGSNIVAGGAISNDRRIRKARIAGSAVFGLQGFFLAVVLAELPQQQDRFKLSDFVIAAGVILVGLLAGGGSLLAENISARWSSRTALQIGLALTAFVGIGITVAPTMPIFLLLLGIYGIAVGVIDAGANMQAVAIQNIIGRFVLSSFYAAGSLGSMCGASFAALCAHFSVSLTETTLLAVVIVLVGGVFNMWLLAKRESDHSTKAEGPLKESGVPLKSFLRFGVVLALFFAIDIAIGNYAVLYLKNELSASSEMAPLALAAYYSTAFFARLTGDYWVRRWGTRRVGLVAAVIAGIGLFVAVGASSVTVAIVGFFITGVITVFAPLCFGEVAQLAEGEELNALIARLNVFNYVGTLTGGIIVGGIISFTNHRWGLTAAAVGVVVLVIFSRVFTQKASASAAVRLLNLSLQK